MSTLVFHLSVDIPKADTYVGIDAVTIFSIVRCIREIP